MRLILMRHGESTSDLEPRRIEGMADFPLTETGLAQARALGRRVAAEYQLDELICSPLQRARQTAAAITAASGITPQIDAHRHTRGHHPVPVPARPGAACEHASQRLERRYLRA